MLWSLAPISEKSRYRDLFILLKGLLMTADWMASGHQGDDAMIDASRHFLHIDSYRLFSHVKAKVESDRKTRDDETPFEGYRPFQEQCGDAQGHVLAIAPTGSGKTEAACLWALRQSERGHARKLFFLLPTMVTANSVHKRLVDFFSEREAHEVGLVHSTAELINNGIEGNEADRATIRRNSLWEPHFFPPVVVGTVDQLLVTLFHAGRWAMKTLAAADAAIVVDEVHAYDPHTAGLLILLIEQLRDLGARFLVMSATMPSDLQSTIRRTLEGCAGTSVAPVSLVKDETYTGASRNEWRTSDTPLTECLTKTRKEKLIPSPYFRKLWGETTATGDPIKILIVVNTVQRCQELAKALSKFSPVCYHSKFIFRDRYRKERQILDEKPRLLIATQVVEVSLELDYDVMHTECAAFDALAQRAGRVNRSRRDVPGRIVVHPAEKGSDKIYNSPHGVLKRSWELCRANQGRLTEGDLIRLTEEAYAGFVLAENRDFADIMFRALDQQLRLSGVLDNPRPDEQALKARLETYPQVSVIPECFLQEIMQPARSQAAEALRAEDASLVCSLSQVQGAQSRRSADLLDGL